MIKLLITGGLAGGLAEGWIDRCLLSVSSQTYGDWECAVVLDPTNDDTYKKACRYRTHNLHVSQNRIPRYQVFNWLEAAKLLRPDDEDIIVLGPSVSDCFYVNDALQYVADVYHQTPQTLVTYGNFIPYTEQGYLTLAQEEITKQFLPEHQFAEIRHYWKGSPFRTMKYKVLKSIHPEHLKNHEGDYLQTGDRAIMVPALEMAGFKRTRWINDVLYTHNVPSENSTNKTIDNWLNARQSYELWPF